MGKINDKRGLMPANRSMPPGKITPELVYDELEAAVKWLCQAFGFRERLRLGEHRAQLVFEGEGLIAKTDPNGRGLLANQPGVAARGVDHSIMVQVSHVDRHFENAVRWGAKVISPPEDYPFGERQYTVDDIGGHRWTFSESTADVDPGDWGGRLIYSGEDA